MKSSALSIVLRRRGHKHNPMYSIVVLSGNGVFLEKIGFFNINISNRIFFLDFQRFGFWLNNGARINYNLRKYLSKLVFD